MTLTKEEIHRLNHPYQTRAGRVARDAEAVIFRVSRSVPHILTVLSLPAAVLLLVLFNVFAFRQGTPW